MISTDNTSHVGAFPKCPAKLATRNRAIFKLDSQSAELTVLLAQPRSFCAGVVRAIEIVEQALRQWGAPVYVLHEIVHSPHVLADLARQGAVFVDDVDEIPEGARMVISAHGTAQGVERRAAARRLEVFDATCPFVRKVHQEGRMHAKKGRNVVLIGHRGHAETVGTLGQVDAPVHLVQDEADVAGLAISKTAPVGYITQTTLAVDEANVVVAALRRRFADVTGPASDDICYATQNRQAAVRRLCQRADRLLVIGAVNSSNSNRLRELGERLGVSSHLIDSHRDLRPEWFADRGTIGLTAGASAPEYLVTEVIEAIGRIVPTRVETLEGPTETLSLPLPPALRTPYKARRCA